MSEYSEEQVLNLSKGVEVVLTDEEIEYLSTQVIKSRAAGYARTLLAGQRITPKKDIDEDLAHRLQMKKFDHFIKSNGLIYCYIREKWIGAS